VFFEKGATRAPSKKGLRLQGTQIRRESSGERQ